MVVSASASLSADSERRAKQYAAKMALTMATAPTIRMVVTSPEVSLLEEARVREAVGAAVGLLDTA